MASNSPLLQPDTKCLFVTEEWRQLFQRTKFCVYIQCGVSGAVQCFIDVKAQLVTQCYLDLLFVICCLCTPDIGFMSGNEVCWVNTAGCAVGLDS